MGATTNAFTILNAVTRHGSTGLGFSAIVHETGLPKASVHRLVKELTSLGALVFNEKDRTYQGGLLLAHLGSTVSVHFDLAGYARPHLAALQKETGYVATLGIIDGNRGIYVDKVEPSGFGLKLHSEIGRAFPLHCTAMGKVLLAYSDTAAQQPIFKSAMPRFTDNTIGTAKALKAELAKVKDLGYAEDAEEITLGMTCIAAPVMDADGNVIAAMSCTFPTSIEDSAGKERVINLVKQYASFSINA